MWYPVLIDTASGSSKAELRKESIGLLDGRLGALAIRVTVTGTNGGAGSVTMSRPDLSDGILCSVRCSTWTPAKGVTGLALDVAAVRRHLRKTASLADLEFPPGTSTQETYYVLPFVDLRSPAFDGEINGSDLEEVQVSVVPPSVSGLTVTGVTIAVYALSRPGARIVPIKTTIREYSINDHEQRITDALAEDVYVLGETVDRTIDVYRGGVQLGRPAPMSLISKVVEGMDDPDYHVAVEGSAFACVSTVYPPHEVARLREGEMRFSVVGGATWTSGVRLVVVGREPVTDRDVRRQNPAGLPMSIKGIRGSKPIANVPPRIRWYTPIRIGTR